MLEHASIESASDGRAREWHSAHVRDGWARVEVDLVELVAHERAWRLRAVVRLGVLVPADVRVELVRAGPSTAEEDAAPCALWASQSYDNGRYVFEALAPRGDSPPPHEWRLRVRPMAPVPVPPVERPVRVAATLADAVPTPSPFGEAPRRVS